MIKRYSIVIVTLVFLFFQSSFRSGGPDLRSIIIEQAKLFTVQVDALQQSAQAYAAGELPLPEFKQQLLKTRASYKGIEYIVEYYYPEHTKEHLNGPPLFHADPYPH